MKQQTDSSPVPRSNDLHIGFIDEEDDGQWNGYVSRHIGATIYHHLEWKSLIEEVFQHRCYYLIARRGHVVVGVLPTVRLSSRLFGTYLVSMPFFNYGGALADSPSIEAALMVEAASLAKRTGCSHFECRDLGPRPLQWPARLDKVVMELALPDSTEALDKQLGSKIRAQIKRPLKAGATASTGSLELLDKFYTVFARNMRDLGTPVYDKRLFASILRTFPDTTRLIIIDVGGRPAAAGFILRSGSRLEIPWASSLRDFNHVSVNMMLYWEVLSFAIHSGCDTFDFGRSSKGSGPYRFKRQWGALERQLHWHYWVRDGADMPGLTPDNPRYRAAIQVWQKLPVFLTRIIGPPLVKNLP